MNDCPQTPVPEENASSERDAAISPQDKLPALGQRILSLLYLPLGGAALLLLFVPFLLHHNTLIDLSALYGVPVWNMSLYYCAGLSFFWFAAAQLLFRRESTARAVLSVSALAAAAAFSLFLLILSRRVISPAAPSLFFWNRYAQLADLFAWFALPLAAASIALFILTLTKGDRRNERNG